MLKITWEVFSHAVKIFLVGVLTAVGHSTHMPRTLYMTVSLGFSHWLFTAFIFPHDPVVDTVYIFMYTLQCPFHSISSACLWVETMDFKVSNTIWSLSYEQLNCFLESLIYLTLMRACLLLCLPTVISQFFIFSHLMGGHFPNLLLVVFDIYFGQMFSHHLKIFTSTCFIYLIKIFIYFIF